MEAALLIRAREPQWPITIISEESDHFFSRTAMMWVCCGQMNHQDIEPLQRDAYANANLTRIRARALGIDRSAQQVLLAGDHPPVPYDQLLIACGSRPRPGPWKGSQATGVGHFVTMQDLEWLEDEIHGGPASTRAPRHDAHLRASNPESPYFKRGTALESRGSTSSQPAVIGGGLIGIEAIEIMVAAKRTPHFFIRDEWFWPIALDTRESRWIGERMEQHGVQVHLEHEIEELVTDDNHRLTGIRTNQGEFGADLAVVAIGVMPNTDWMANSGVELHPRGGIPVNGSQATNDPNIFAAGDCAVLPWWDGTQRPEQLWYTSRDQGRVAARSMLGEKATYQRGLWYNSAKLMDIEYTTAGFVNLNITGERNWYFEEQGSVRSTIRIVTLSADDQDNGNQSDHNQGQRVIGFNMLGRRWDHSILLQWIRERRSLQWVLDHLKDASFDTELTPPLRIPKSALQQEPIAATARKTNQPTIEPPTFF